MTDQKLMETSIALEITRFQRDSLKDQIDQLSAQLQSTTQRAERAEARLHDTTVMLSNLSMQATAMVKMSSVSEVFIEGRGVLRLSNPVLAPAN
jgi:chromosome segregation ATPase